MTEPNQAQITTVLPTYRRPALLRRAMRSVLEQDYGDVRLCVYDNASGDETGDVVATLAATDQRISYHRHERNIGGAANFEFGLQRIETPFFSILSDDDYLLPGFYRRAMEDLARHPEAMFWAGITLNVDESGRIWDAKVARWRREGLYRPPEGLLMVTGGMSPTWTGIVFRKSVLDVIGCPDKETLGPSDLDFVLKAAANFQFVIRKYPVAVFTLGSESFSASEPMSSFWPGWLKMFKNMSELGCITPGVREELLLRLHADAKRMLFRRAVNALAKQRGGVAEDAEKILRDYYGLVLKAWTIRTLNQLCRNSLIFQRVFIAAYRTVENKMINSRRHWLKKYEALVKKY